MAIGIVAHLLNSCHTEYLLLVVIAESADRYISIDPFNYSDAELKINSAISFVSLCHLHLFPFDGCNCLQWLYFSNAISAPYV